METGILPFPYLRAAGHWDIVQSLSPSSWSTSLETGGRQRVEEMTQTQKSDFSFAYINDLTFSFSW